MAPGRNKKTVNLLNICNREAYVLLNRLTREDLDRYYTNVRNKHPLPTSWSQATIKQEFHNSNNTLVTANYESTLVTTWHHYETSIKIEPTDLSLIKSEPIDTYETTIESSTFSNRFETFQNTYNCNSCYEIFSNYEDFIVHKNLSHNNKPYKCQICNEQFGLIAHLDNHLLTHINNTSSTNSSLNLAIQSSSQNDSNIRIKRSYRKRKSTQNSSNIVSQINSKSNVKKLQGTKEILSYQCKCCDFKTNSKIKFGHHNNICASTPKIKNPVFSCDLCSRSYKTRSALSGHMRFHSLRGHMISKRSLRKNNDTNISFENSQTNSSVKIKNKITCQVCNKQFVLKKRFETHLLLHKTKSTLATEVALVKPIKRKYVKKIKSPAEIEKLNNIQLKPFQCSNCKHFYSSKKSLSEHVRRYHKIVKSFLFNKITSKKCSWCNSIVSKRNYLRHVSCFHPKVKLVICSDCPLKFKDLASLNIHISKCHKI